MRHSKGFTLIELMIVVAIIGILAAIAIPNFLAMQLRSKRAELPTNLDAVRTAELAYFAEWDAFTTAVATPNILPGRLPTAFAGTGLEAFELLGWTADGNVRGQYSSTAAPATAAFREDFLAVATSDVDGDTIAAAYNTNRTEKSYMLTSNNIY